MPTNSMAAFWRGRYRDSICNKSIPQTVIDLHFLMARYWIARTDMTNAPTSKEWSGHAHKVKRLKVQVKSKLAEIKNQES